MSSSPTSAPDNQAVPTIVSVESPAPRPAWRAVVDADPLVTPSQTPAWADAMVATGRYADASRLYTLSDGRRLVVPLVRFRGVGGPLGGLSSLPNAWGAGGVIGERIDDASVRRVVDDLVGVGALRLQIRPNPLHTTAFDRAVPADAVRVPRRAHLLTLPSDEQTLWNDVLSARCRRSVNRARRSGIEIEHDTTGRLARVYNQLLQHSVVRWASRQHEPAALARWRADRRDPLDKWQAIARCLDGDCHFYVARLDRDPVAAIVVLRGKNTHYTRAVMDKERAAPVEAGHLLLYRAMVDSVEHGSNWFHMGETGTNPGLTRFKEKFGAVGHDHMDFLVERLPITKTDRVVRGAVKKALRFQD